MALSNNVFCLILTTLSVGLVSASNGSCSDSWLYIDLHDRVTEGKNNSFSYGLFIGAGTSSQNQSLWPSVVANETYLASHEYCTQASPANCDDPIYTHGHFGPDFSSTWNATPSYASLDSNSASTGVNVTYGQDNLNIFTHYFDPSPASKYVVTGHPISMLSSYTSAQDVFFHSGSVGLGPSSTLMKQLLDEGRINRNVVGMYLGTAYPRAGGAQNGSIVLGGYDSGRFEGTSHRYAQDPAPPQGASALKLHIKQVSLVTEDGSSIGLVTDAGFDAHISTSQYSMDLPQTITNELATALKADPSGASDAVVLQLAQKFNGNLTITLDDGFVITYPSEWISNVSNLTPFSKLANTSNTSTDSRPLVFGTAFLHHLYLTIDYEEKAFYLANAKVSNNYVQPQSLCAGSTPQALTVPSLNRFAQTGMIGAVIGGLVAGFGAAWLAFFCLRRALRKRVSEISASSMELGEAKPKEGSLRKISKLSFLRKKKKDVCPGVSSSNAKRVSESSSDSSSITNATAKHRDGKDVGLNVKGIELHILERKQDVPPQKGLAGSPVSPLTPPVTKVTVLETAEQKLPDPSQFANPYAQSIMPETPYTVATPGTANPLLNSFHRQYSNFDDADDSDLYAQPQGSDNQRQKPMSHLKTTSENIRDKLGLSVSTASASLPPRQGRSKPAPLPLRVNHLPKPSTDEVKMNMSPNSMRSTYSKRHSILRKVFPAA